MKLKLSYIPISLFILCVVSSNISLKIVALIFFLVMFPTQIKVKFNHSIPFFYITLVIITIVFSLPFLLRENYIIGLTISLANLFISLFSFLIIYSYVNSSSNDKNKLIIDSVFYFIVSYTFIQYVNIVLQFGTINIYSISAATGDFLTSIFSSSSVNMIVMSFYLLYYGFNKELKKASCSVAVILLTGYMSGIVLMIGAIGIWYFTTIKLTRLHFLMGFGAIAVILLFPLLSEGNYYYVLNYFKQAISSKPPYKIISYYETFKYWTSSLQTFIFGAGSINFSSRTAFVVSGDYVSWFPDSYKYISETFSKNHFGIWTHDFMNPYNNRNNMANQPFSFYNRIIGEFGVIGLIAYLLTYFNFLFKHAFQDSLIKLMFIFFSLILLTDYWFEYLSVVIIFELLLLARIRTNITKKYA